MHGPGRRRRRMIQSVEKGEVFRVNTFPIALITERACSFSKRRERGSDQQGVENCLLHFIILFMVGLLNLNLNHDDYNCVTEELEGLVASRVYKSGSNPSRILSSVCAAGDS
jgi:hypothetical protein